MPFLLSTIEVVIVELPQKDEKDTLIMACGAWVSVERKRVVMHACVLSMFMVINSS